MEMVSETVTMTSKQFETLCLYYMEESPPCRHVLLTAKVLGIELNLKPVNLKKGEHLTAAFLRLNPEHKIPVLTDNDFVLYESRPIMIYLTEKYGKIEQLYPKELQLRAKINQLLYFDSYSLLEPIISYYVPLLLEDKNVDEKQMPKIEKAFELLNTFLSDNEYVTGEHLTLADIALVSSVATALAGTNISLRLYKNVDKWYRKLKTALPCFNVIIDANCRKLKSAIERCKQSK